jgi:hypothetical protein
MAQPSSKVALNICAGLGLFAIAVLYLVEGPRQFLDFLSMVPSAAEAISEKPHLLVEAQGGLANEPLPVGIIAAGASDGATITIEGLPDGADLSFGSRSDHSGWTLTVADLEHSFVGAPTGFVGIMEPTATLRSVSGKLLDRQALHFEWRARKGDPPVTSPVNNGAASAGSAAAPSTSSSSPKPALALPPLAVPPAGTANAIECQSSPPPYSKSHWAWRLVDNKKCWYAGEPGMDKSKLHWAANADQAPAPAQRTPPEPAKRIALPPAHGPISGRN